MDKYGQVYEIGDMVTDVEGRLLVVEDAHCVSSFDYDNPDNWDYVLVDKDLNEFFVGHRSISHKANHLRLPSDHRKSAVFVDSLCQLPIVDDIEPGE